MILGRFDLGFWGENYSSGQNVLRSGNGDAIGFSDFVSAQIAKLSRAAYTWLSILQPIFGVSAAVQFLVETKACPFLHLGKTG